MLADILKGMALGAFYGLEAGIINYMSGEDLPVSWSSLLTKKFWTDLSLTKLAKTMLLGAIVGAITRGYSFITPEQWTQFTAETGFPQIPLPIIINIASTVVYMGVDRLAKFMFRRTPLMHAWNGLKARILKLLLDLENLEAMSKQPPKLEPTPPASSS